MVQEISLKTAVMKTSVLGSGTVEFIWLVDFQAE